MADSTILISDLTEISTIDDSAYMVVDDGTATNKITVENFNATATASAQAYAEAAASSATDASDYADNCSTIQTTIEGYVSTAEDAATNASGYATNAASSASSAAGYASTASTAATNAASYASSASSSATTASNNATLAESWAIGGTGARSDEATNNSLYYSGVASANATNAATSASNAATSETNAAASEDDAEAHALVSEGYAVGTQDGTAVSSGTYYQNNAKYYAENAATSAEAAEAWSAHPPYIGTNGNWYVYDTTQSAFVDTNVEATGPQGETGNGIASVAKTATAGLVDTYTMTFTDGTTTTFTVTNGQNGTGSGDMLQSDYDANYDVYNVGGIPTYVGNQITSGIGALDYSDSAVSGSYVTAVNEVDGVIATTKEAADATPTQSSNKMVTSGGVYSALATKADAATTLAGYGIADAYTKTETDSSITSAIEALDVTDTAVAGSYVTEVSETDGEIAVTREAADVTPTDSSTKLVTSGGVYTALEEKCAESVVSDAYDSTKTYTVGELFIYNDVLYHVDVACTGITPPNANYYTATSVASQINSMNIYTHNLTDLVTVYNGAVGTTKTLYEATATKNSTVIYDCKFSSDTYSNCAVWINDVTVWKIASAGNTANANVSFANYFRLGKGDKITVIGNQLTSAVVSSDI